MKRTIDEILTNLQAMGNGNDIELWIIINRVSTYLDIDPKKMTLQQAENFWSVMSEIITKMLQTGFIAIDLTQSRGFGHTVWPEQEPKQVLTQIKNKWFEVKGKFPDAGFIVWFHKPKPT